MDATLRNGGVSFWWEGFSPTARPELTDTVQADVVIVGAGYTGLWTAYYLAEADPALRIVLVESRHAGFGASGRNGGWLTSAVAGHRGRIAARHGRETAVRLQQEMVVTVDEVLARAASEGIACDVAKGGVLQVARNPAQLHRLRAVADEERWWGDAGARLLDAGEAQECVGVAGTVGGYWSPHTARIHPVKLVRGLAEVVERKGGQIYERSPVVDVKPGAVRTLRGEVRAPAVVVATEGFSAALPGWRRRLLPMNSSMIATEPLPAEIWEELRWDGGQVLGDMAHAYMYAQRTSDDRIALGGRGIPYRYGSRTDHDGQTADLTVRQLVDMLHSMFPAVRTHDVTHAWSGVLGVPRDWCSSVSFDRASGLGFAGGYVGHGVAAANLSGRIMCDLVRGRETALTALPNVGWRHRRWEPEPLRWLGVQAMYAAYRMADRRESRTGGGTALLARVADRASGRS